MKHLQGRETRNEVTVALIPLHHPTQHYSIVTTLRLTVNTYRATLGLVGRDLETRLKEVEQAVPFNTATYQISALFALPDHAHQWYREPEQVSLE